MHHVRSMNGESLARRPVLIGLAAWTVALSVMLTLGCMSVTPAAPGRLVASVKPQTLPDIRWPERYPELLHEYLSTQFERERPISESGLDANVVRAIDSLCLFAPTCHRRESAVVVSGDWTPGCLVLVNSNPPDRFAELSGSSPPRLTRREGINVFAVELVHYVSEPLGYVIHLVSVGEQHYEDRVSARLADRGWMVFKVQPLGFTFTMVESDADEADCEVSGRAEPDWRIIPPAQTARSFDDYWADYAYAVEAAIKQYEAWEFISEEKPLVLVGYSAGAVALPTIAARLGNRVAAAVLIGGGVDFASILLHGRFTDISRRLQRQGHRALADELTVAYRDFLRYSRLDPFDTAPLLTAVPTLLIEGSFDRIIPGRSRELLYKRLNNPERWRYPLGHALLFLHLPSQAGRIAAWIEQAVDHRPSHEREDMSVMMNMDTQQHEQ